MKSIQLKTPEILHIYENNKLYYGASQQFYSKYLRRMSGCGPTTASNQLVYLAKTRPELAGFYTRGEINHDTMLTFMNIIWNYVTPTIRGVDKLQILAEGVKRYSLEVGLPVEIKTLIIDHKRGRSLEDVANWLYNELAKDSPIAFLNLDNGEVSNLPKWHWVLLVGISLNHNKLSAIIYDEGEKKQIDLGLWLETTRLTGGFVSVG